MDDDRCVARCGVLEKARTEQLIAEEFLNRLAEVLPVGIVRTDAEGECTYVNERWCGLTGLDRRQALGDGWAQALHPGGRARIFAKWKEVSAEAGAFAEEFRFRAPGA